MSGGWNTIKIDKADQAFSKYVRTKANWKCARCDRAATGRGLHAAHFYGRRKETTRFDLENVDALCAKCHKHFTEHYTEHKAWKLKQLGQAKYDLLMLRANTSGKKERELQYILWTQELKKLVIKA